MTTEPAGHEDLAGLLEKLSTDDYSLIGAEIYKREAHAAIIKLEQENAKLREVLTPFASNYAGREAYVDDWLIGGTAYPALNNGHLRCAAEILQVRESGCFRAAKA